MARNHAPRVRTRPWAWFALGAIAALAAVAYVADRREPSLTSPSTSLPALAAPAATPGALPPGTVAVVDGVPVVGRPLRIRLGGGKANVSIGTSIRVQGTTPTKRGGIVVTKIRWDGGPWRVVHRSRANANGAYSAAYRLAKRGRAQVRIVFPGGSFAYKWYRVN